MGAIIREEIIQASLQQEVGAGWAFPEGVCEGQSFFTLVHYRTCLPISESIENLCITMSLIINKSIAVCL